MTDAHLIIVPTSGNILQPLTDGGEGSDLVPGRVCQCRLQKAAELLGRNRTDRLAIAGGYHSNLDRGEAAVAERWFRQMYPDLIDRILIVDAQSNHTAGDMSCLSRRIVQGRDTFLFKELIIVSHPDQGEFAKLVLRIRLQKSFWRSAIIKLEPSGESAPYSKFRLTILKFVYRHDPLWERWPSYLLRWHAERRGNNK